MHQSKSDRRTGSLERARTYTWKNSKLKRQAKKGTLAELKKRWTEHNETHIKHLESIIIY